MKTTIKLFAAAILLNGTLSYAVDMPVPLSNFSTSSYTKEGSTYRLKYSCFHTISSSCTRSFRLPEYIFADPWNTEIKVTGARSVRKILRRATNSNGSQQIIGCANSSNQGRPCSVKFTFMSGNFTEKASRSNLNTRYPSAFSTTTEKAKTQQFLNAMIMKSIMNNPGGWAPKFFSSYTIEETAERTTLSNQISLQVNNLPVGMYAQGITFQVTTYATVMANGLWKRQSYQTRSIRGGTAHEAVYSRISTDTLIGEVEISEPSKTSFYVMKSPQSVTDGWILDQIRPR